MQKKAPRKLNFSGACEQWGKIKNKIFLELDKGYSVLSSASSAAISSALSASETSSVSGAASTS